MTVYTPPRWTTPSAFDKNDFPEEKLHPFNGIAWLLSDRSSIISEMSQEQTSVINDMIGELEKLETGVIIEKSQKRARRRARILKAQPLKTNDDELQAAFHVATLNRQISLDDIPYESFKLLYDDITNILRNNKQ